MLHSENPLDVAELLERAYRLAQGLEGLSGARVLATPEPDAQDYGQWALASELLFILDGARTVMLREKRPV